DSSFYFWRRISHANTLPAHHKPLMMCFIFRVLLANAKKKRPAFSSGALLCRAEAALFDRNKLRLARANDALGICEAVHTHGHPAAIHEHEVRVPDQPEMG